ncbi:MAG: ABC transporter permease [Clostridia bacterium]|nr:ABC transporter permease [Clostridia bacterium]
MKHFIIDTWLNIRKSPFLFLFMFIQIVITSLIVYITLANYYWTRDQSNSAQIAWGDKSYFRLVFQLNVPYDVRSSLLFSTIRKNGEDVPEYIELFKRIDGFYNDALKIDGLTLMTAREGAFFSLSEIKDWQDEDKYEGDQSIFAIDTRHEYRMLNTYYVDSEYLGYFNVKLSEGQPFCEEDFLYDSETIPVIMGDTYRKYFTLGEEFKALDEAFQRYKTYKVIGFTAKNQFYCPVNMAGTVSHVYSYDNIILLPAIERDFETIFNNHKDQIFLFTGRINNAFLIIEPKRTEEILPQIDELLKKYELDDIYRTFKSRTEKELASNYYDQLIISVAVCIATILFSLFSFIFTMLYKIDSNIKNYAIHMVVGETYSGIAVRYIFESFFIFLIAQLTGYFAFRIYSAYSYIYHGYSYLEISTIRTGIIINVIFFIIAAIVLIVAVNLKMRNYSIATLIRGNEVKKERRMPLYRVIIFCMLAIVGIFSMFIASYQVAVDRIDIYYNSYYTKNVKAAYVQNNTGENPSEAKVNIKEIGANAENAIINRYINAFYKGDDFIDERGLYFNGYIDPVNMLEGRFFTKEESAGKEKIAVVGKEIYNKYVTVNENNEPIYHCDALDMDLKVIGVMGKEDQATSIDLTVFIPINHAMSKFLGAGSYTLDGKDQGTVERLAEEFEKHISSTGTVNIRDYHPRFPVEAPTDMLIMLLIIIIINAVVFCFYYVSKQGHIHAVKKIVGYSKLMILADTFTDFLLLTVGAFVTGNAIVILLKETIFKEVQLFSIYMLDPQVIIISLVAVVALTVLLSVIAIARTFTSGKTNEYRV